MPKPQNGATLDDAEREREKESERESFVVAYHDNFFLKILKKFPFFISIYMLSLFVFSGTKNRERKM